MIRHLAHHRRSLTRLLLAVALHVVSPHQQDRQTIRRSLPALRESYRLSLVVRLAVSNDEIQ